MLTQREIVRQAIIWAEESIGQMINGLSQKDPHRAELAGLLKQMKAYYRRRYGKPADPLAGCKAMTLDELRKLKS